MSTDFLPVTGSVLPRFAGVATLMRLPLLSLEDPRIKQVDIGLVGVPWDGGTTNRPGARHGPRQVRDLSTMVRNVNRASGLNPFALCNCADLGDAPVNPVDLHDSLKRIESFFEDLLQAGIAPRR
jgi:guanidinopropionase